LSETLLFAQEPLWNKNGSRTHEHWVQIEKDGKRYLYSYGDERGTIDSKVGDDLADLLSEAYEQKVYYDMEVETDTITPKHEEKEMVQFT
jgi:hypothetical protein